MNHSEEHPPNRKFNPTRWSLVLQTKGEGAEAKRALEDLCQTYWFPLYAWCRRYGLPPAESEDMVQSFFVKVIEKKLFEDADAKRGKLRTFLLTILQRHVKDEANKASALRRGAGQVISFDSLEAEEWYEGEKIEGESAEHLFDRQWALTVLDNAIRDLEEDATKKDKSPQFAAMQPFLTNDGSTEAYQSAGENIGMTANAFKVGVHRLRSKFKIALRSQVAETQLDDSNINEEISYLIKVLQGG